MYYKPLRVWSNVFAHWQLVILPETGLHTSFKISGTYYSYGFGQSMMVLHIFGWVEGESLSTNQHTLTLAMSWMFVLVLRYLTKPITVAAWSKAWTVFACSNPGIVGLKATRGMDVCVRLFYVCVVLCVGSGLATGWSPVQGVLPAVYRLRSWKSGQGPKKGCRAIDRQTDR
jgi:hypothetical protein